MTLNGDGKDINVLSRMTPQEEAIKWFEEEAQRLPDDSSNKALLKVAIKALQKQMPTKLTHEATGWGIPRPEIDTCPSCKNSQDIEYPHCRYCGQALDWSDLVWRDEE